MSRLLCALTLFSTATLGFIAGGGYIEHKPQASFDYETCRAIVAKGSLATNPGVPEDWHEMVITPGGNWCIR